MTVFLSCMRHHEEKVASSAAASPDTAETRVQPCTRQWSHTVKRGETFISILLLYSNSTVRGNEFYRALCASGLSKLYPGDSLLLITGCDSALAELSLLSRKQYWYHAGLHDSAVFAERTPLEVTVTRNLVNGTLETSLFEAMQTHGLGPLLACKLADIFAWDINFFIDPRKGDTFQIIFEQKFAENRFIGYGNILAARYNCGGRNFYAIGYRDSCGSMLYYDTTGRSVQKEFLKAPLQFSRISSLFTYHRRHPILGIIRPHLAIDYAAPSGTPVYAAADGTIRTAGWDKGYGKLVIIDHGGSFSTCYGHLASISAGIRGGAHVKQGDMIGTVGATGLATGPHLDYRMLNGSRPVNPLTINLPSKSGISPAEKEEFNRTFASQRSLFNHRFSHKAGYFILDMNHTAARDSTTRLGQPPLSIANNGTKPDNP